MSEYVSSCTHTKPKDFQLTMAILRFFGFACLLVLINDVAGFSPARTAARQSRTRKLRTSLEATQQKKNNESFGKTAASALLGVVLLTSAVGSPSNAYDTSDYASDTVTAAVQAMKSSGPNADKVFKAYEDIAAIITEGKGVGGEINYQGIQLERGYVADEDTTIYNPGLTLLTESEKERLVEGVIDARKAGLKANTWTDNNQVAYEFLKEKLDPLHMVELRGYLGILPVYAAALYTIVLGVQQFERSLFPTAYILAAAAVFLPVFALVAAGP